MLMDAGADVSVANEQGNTALLLACKAGNLELATKLMEAGADVSVANKQGDNALLAALAELLVSWGADIKAQRRDGAGLIALAIHSKRPDSISFALRHGPKRIASQSTFDARAWAQARLRATSSDGFSLVRPQGHSRSRSGPCYCIPRRMLAGSTTCAPCSTCTRNFYRTRQNGRSRTWWSSLPRKISAHLCSMMRLMAPGRACAV
jgi:hypothetical protein